jgi:hypothetical protein
VGILDERLEFHIWALRGSVFLSGLRAIHRLGQGSSCGGFPHSPRDAVVALDAEFLAARTYRPALITLDLGAGAGVTGHSELPLFYITVFELEWGLLRIVGAHLDLRSLFL